MSAALPPPQPTVLLLHVQEAGTHYDWLIAQPGRDDLWTARLRDPSSRWAEIGTFELEQSTPHRRAYLTYEGQIAGNRGRVERIDEGLVQVRSWTDDAVILDVTMRDFHGTIHLLRQSPVRWTAHVDAAV